MYPFKQIKLWIRQERLILSKASPDGILCESCGSRFGAENSATNAKPPMQNKLANALDKPKGTVVEKVERDGQQNAFFIIEESRAWTGALLFFL